MKNFFKNYKSTVILLLAMIAGAVIGAVWGEGAGVLKPFGELFLNMLLVIIVPLIFVTITLSIAKMQQPKRLGKIMGTILIVIVVTSLIAVLVGVLAGMPLSLVHPEDSQAILAELSSEAAPEAVETSILQSTVQAISVGDFSQLLSRSNLIALIVASILTGIAVMMSGEKAAPFVAFLDASNHIIENFIKLIMYYAPVGIGCYSAALVGTFGGEIALGYAKTFVAYTLISLAFFFVVYSLYALFAAGPKGCRAFWSNVLPAAATALSTCSSAAAIPVNIDCVKKMGVSDDIAETLIPLGTNLHKDGSIIGSVFKILFLVCLFGTKANVGQLLAVALVATLLVTAVPIGGGTISEMMILTMMGFPVGALPILTIIATIIDPPATLLNVVGNTSSAMLAARMVDGKDWMTAKKP